MKKFYLLCLACSLVLGSAFFNSAKACYANFVHTNACVGDTVWFYGLDISAVHVWDFGDSTVNNPNLAFDDTAYHVYTNSGTYYVSHFVNIGAEWAFETQQITVGAICFEAAFDTRCGGATVVTFINQSVGSGLSYSWDFGDPSSGTADTSSLLSPYHSFTASGNYIVTLVISDGTNSDTSTQSVAVDTTCMSTFISYQWNPCAGDTTFFYYNFTGVNSVYWDFGDPASGINNYSTVLTPTHIFATPGTYVGMVIFSNGIDTDTLPVVTTVVDCSVWPGDANRDGYVTGEDFFAIALYYGDSGTARTNATTNFTGQASVNWTTSSSWNYMYLQDFMDKKFADCNGDGFINAADAAVISQNFGMSHQQHNNLSSMMVTSAADPVLSLELPAVVSGSTAIAADLNYGDSLIHTPMYGICAYIYYNPAQVDAATIAVDFSNSFLDSISVSNLLTFYYNDIANSRLILVETRTDHNGMNHFGNLAHITFNAVQGYAGILQLTLGSETKVMSNSVYTGGTFGNVQNIFKVNTLDASTQVSLGVLEYGSDRQISVYPNPASGFVHLNVKKGIGNYSVKIIDATGRILSEKYPVSNHQLVDIRDLAAGFYFLEVNGNGWTCNTKILIRK